MYEIKPISPRELIAECAGIVAGETNLVANLANISSLIFHSLPQLNWCGFYLRDLEKEQLVLGPFQGRPACIRIPKGKGVCGVAWLKGETLNVPNVDEFPTHIACDSASKSELVVPIFKPAAFAGQSREFMGVLDLDSPVTHRFDLDLEEAMNELVKRVVAPLF